VQYVRCYAGPDGESHFEDAKLELKPENLGGANVLGIPASIPFAPATLYFARIPAGQGEWHTAPDRRLLIWLHGDSMQEASDGTTRHLEAGDVLLLEDTTGQGHRSISRGEGLVAMIPLAR
jgi:hypothetical protein